MKITYLATVAAVGLASATLVAGLDGCMQNCRDNYKACHGTRPEATCREERTHCFKDCGDCVPVGGFECPHT
ncbi:hypothetical protein GQ42DRAFT_11306 [Ramicandelaber brevisporus]|nr:hypothetical protein GQ42DRAFT_11306 [Ramicandelaber brevisporus]